MVSISVYVVGSFLHHSGLNCGLLGQSLPISMLIVAIIFREKKLKFYKIRNKQFKQSFLLNMIWYKKYHLIIQIF